MHDSEADALLSAARVEKDEERRRGLHDAIALAGPAVVKPMVERLLRGKAEVDRMLGAELICAMPSLTEEERAILREGGFRVAGTAPFSEADRAALAPLVNAALDHAATSDVLIPLIAAAGKLGRPELLDAVLRHIDSNDEDVREACAMALDGLEPEGLSHRAIAALVHLAQDPVERGSRVGVVRARPRAG